jgi:hypothetical protein
MKTDSAFRENVKLIIVRRFINEAKATIYAAYLRGKGVHCFISNTTAGTLLPFINGGFLLHIEERDLEETNDLLDKLDQNASTRPDEDYRDADLADIAYEKAVSDYDRRLEKSGGRSLAVLLIVIALILSALFAFVRSSKTGVQSIGMNNMTTHNSPTFVA